MKLAGLIVGPVLIALGVAMVWLSGGAWFDDERLPSIQIACSAAITIGCGFVIRNMAKDMQ